MKNIIKISIMYLIITTSIISAHDVRDKDSIVKITSEEELKALLQNSLGPCAISFHMDRCGWCMKMHPIFENLAKDKQFEHITFYSVNGPMLKASVHVKDILDEPITGYPTILFMNQGKVVDKQIGGTTHEVMKEKLHKHLPKSSTKKAKDKKSNKVTKTKQSKKTMITAAAAQKIATA